MYLSRMYSRATYVVLWYVFYILALTPEGSGRQMRKVMKGPDPEWKMGSPFCVAGFCPEEEDDSSYSSALLMDTSDEELEEELEDV